MTVVAWDGETLAADRRAVVGSRSYSVVKVHRIDADRIMGIAGHLQLGMEMVEWIRAGADPSKIPADKADEWGTALLIHRDGRVWRYEGRAVPVEVHDTLHAIGSGADCALGAMSCGRNAVEAVEVASQWISDCGNGVDALRFE